VSGGPQRPATLFGEHPLLIAIPVALTILTWFVFVTDGAPGTSAAMNGFPLDDAWIHLVYARSLAEEGGLNYNQGTPETGMTSPLWVVIAAGAHAVTGPRSSELSSDRSSHPARRIVRATKVLSLAFGIAGVIALFALARALGEGRWVALGAASLAALDPSLTFARASGMEVPLFVALVTLAFVFALRARALLAGAAAGLAVVARPEGAVLLPLLALLLARREVRRRPHAVRDLALAALFAALPSILYALFCLHATGAPLPNTFYAKFAPQNPLSFNVLAFGWRNYVGENAPYFTLQIGALLAISGAARLIARRGWLALLTLGAGVILFVSSLATRGFAPGHFFYWERWLLPAFPFLIVAIVSGLGAVADVAARLARRIADGRAESAARALTAAALGALLLWPLPRALRERADLFAWNCQNIEEVNVALGRWVAANIPANVAVAVNDAGALRYFGGHTTVDLLGLNDHKILRRDPREGMKPLVDRGVRYFVIFPSWFRDFVQTIPLTPVHEARSPHYTICEAEQDLMVVYRWERP
jgi:hypothetical protein